MNPASPNAFIGNFFSSDAHPRGSLAGMLAAMRASLESTGFGFRLHLQPLRFSDVMSRWSDFGGVEAMTLLVDLENQAAQILPDHELRAFVGQAANRKFAAVRVDGPLEPRDVEAIVSAIARGDSPLEFECRAIASLHPKGAGGIELDVRHREHALLVVAEAFRHYVAALRKRSVQDVTPPETWQVQRLLDIGGEISVRPIETEVYTTSIDVGVCAESGLPSKPAMLSLIYDVFSDTWHDEP
ncbi:MAG: hypothetical protein O7G85_05105 [Planctomycetota bacterium]|nr:hypothetical protein [Planctomycetota bacterium]